MAKIVLREGNYYHVEYTALGVGNAPRKMHFTAQFIGPSKYSELQFSGRPDFGTFTIPQEWVDKADPIDRPKISPPKPVK